MKKHAHKEIVDIVATKVGINQKYIKLLRKHACDPDPGFALEDVEKILDTLRNKNLLEQLMDEIDITRTPLEHSHRFAPDNSILLAKAAHRQLKKHNTKEGCIYLTWASHFIVDSGTPYHKDAAESYWEVSLGNNHYIYEAYVDKNWDLFKKSVSIGCYEEMKAPRRFIKSRVMGLTKYSGSLFNRLNIAVEKKDYKVVNSITKSCIKEIAMCTWSLFIAAIKYSLRNNYQRRAYATRT